MRSRSGLEVEATAVPFRFSKFRTVWLYHLTSPVANSKQSKVNAVSICIDATVRVVNVASRRECAFTCSLGTIVFQVFNPKKFNALLTILLQLYLQDCSPIPVLKCVAMRVHCWCCTERMPGQCISLSCHQGNSQHCAGKVRRKGARRAGMARLRAVLARAFRSSTIGGRSYHP